MEPRILTKGKVRINMKQGKITLPACAKINLGLDVLRRRSNGYHDLVMVMQQVSLRDYVTVAVSEGKGEIRAASDDPRIPAGSGNIAYKAAAAFLEANNISGADVDIFIEKRIPSAAGLAGGSADAAAVLKALGALFGITPEGMGETALKVGADVPFCLLGGTALAEGVGEILTPLPDMPACGIVIAKPPFGVSTKDAYEGCDALLLAEAAGERKIARPDTQGLKEALAAGDLRKLCASMGNVLAEVTEELHPEIPAMKAELLELGAAGAMMSGSGPSSFGIFENENEADAAVSALKSRRPDWFFAAARPCGSESAEAE